MSTTAEETEKTTKTELLLDSLEIKGYRCFEHLTIEKLGRVNLIVGKNNVGKTALLEGLWIYCEMRNNRPLSDILLARNELPNRVKETGYNLPNDFENYRHFFYERPFPVYLPNDDWLGTISFEIGSAKNEDNKLSVEFEKKDNNFPPSLKPSFPKYLPNFTTYFINSNGLVNQNIEELWESVQLRESEDFVVKALFLLNDNVITVRLIPYPTKLDNKVPVVRLKERKFKELGENPSVHRLFRDHKVIDDKEPVPLKSLGDGINRLFGIALTLVNCRNGMVFIDEIENGLHYSVLPDVWKLIFKTAKDLNVQVFATTHSKDCIEAFTQAAVDDEESDGMLIRLERRGENIVAKTIEEERLVDAINYDVEVR